MTARKTAVRPTKTKTTAKKATKKVSTKRMASKKKTAKAKAKPEVILTDATTDELWVLYRAEFDKVGRDGSDHLGDMRNVLMERHLPLVRYHAERLQQTLPKSIELDDLISAGQFGLMDAIRGFDPDRGYKFKTYCSTRIRGAILDQLRSQDWVPRLVRLKATKIERMYQKLMGEFGREPTHSELAQHLDLEHDELVKEMEGAKAKAMYSLSEKWDDGDDDKDIEKVEILADRKSVNPVDTIQQRDALDMITSSLTKKERLIILMYYYEGLTMREIGEIMELTESRVCQIHSNVMARLKAQLDRAQGAE